MTKLCEDCGEEIPDRRLKLIPSTIRCVICQSLNDIFKYKMKTVGFGDEPTIARDKETWEVLKKQKKVKDI